MDLKEAWDKYSIAVPPDDVFYSKQYIEYFKQKNGKTDENFEKYRQFNQMYNASFLQTFYVSDDEKQYETKGRVSIILGGQIGAGKSGLIQSSMREARSRGKKLFLIDDDSYRKFYPNAEEILQRCPEYYTILTAIGSGPITPKIMRYAESQGLNFIFEGTMKNARILNTIQTWKDYNVICKIMATSKIESLLSTFERNEFFRQHPQLKKGLFVTSEVHNQAYDGLENTLRQLESLNLPRAIIEVYIRGENVSEPIKVYSSKDDNNRYRSATEALIECRKNDTRRCIQNGVEKRINNLFNSPVPLNQAERVALDELKKEIEMELKKEEQR